MGRHSPPPRPAAAASSSLDQSAAFSIVNWAKLQSPLRSSGGVSAGTKFAMVAPSTIKGVRFLWVSGGPSRTVKCSLWNPSGTRLVSVDQVVAAATAGTFAEYNALFATPYSLPLSLVLQTFTVSIYEPNEYTYFNFNVGVVPAVPFVAGSAMIWHAFNVWNSGDVIPTTVASTEKYAVEPIFTVP